VISHTDISQAGYTISPARTRRHQSTHKRPDIQYHARVCCTLEGNEREGEFLDRSLFFLAAPPSTPGYARDARPRPPKPPGEGEGKGEKIS